MRNVHEEDLRFSDGVQDWALGAVVLASAGMVKMVGNVIRI